MIKNYFKIAWRSLAKNKIFSFINIYAGNCMLLSKDMLKPVLSATTIIAIPVGYYAMNQWLQNLAYRTPLHWWLFVIAALITVGIALFTISFKAVKAATANAVKSLRTE